MLFIQAFFSLLTNKETKPIVYAFFSVMGTGTVAYHFIEGWSWLDSLYFSVITLATVGYGDLHPITHLGKIFTIIYIIIGLGLFLTFINVYFSQVRRIGSDGIKRVRTEKTPN